MLLRLEADDNDEAQTLVSICSMGIGLIKSWFKHNDEYWKELIGVFFSFTPLKLLLVLSLSDSETGWKSEHETTRINAIQTHHLYSWDCNCGRQRSSRTLCSKCSPDLRKRMDCSCLKHDRIA